MHTFIAFTIHPIQTTGTSFKMHLHCLNPRSFCLIPYSYLTSIYQCWYYLLCYHRVASSWPHLLSYYFLPVMLSLISLTPYFHVCIRLSQSILIHLPPPLFVNSTIFMLFPAFCNVYNSRTLVNTLRTLM